MRTLKHFRTIAVSFLMVFAAQITTAQTFKLDNSASTLKVDGTSNIHDWTIEAEKMAGTLTATLENGKISDISQLNLIVVAESLKSGKSGMDKNTFKALNTDKHKQITFTLNKVNRIDCGNNGECKIAANGFLTIAGTKKAVDVNLEAKVSGNRIVLSGNAPLVMSHYKIDPPTAMFGTITTGDKVIVKYQVVFNK